MKLAAFAAALTLLMLAPARARADEEKIAVGDLPKPVVDAVKKKFPDAEMTGASKETEEEKTTFEVELKAGEKMMDVSLTPEGEFTEIETMIAAKDLPEAVSKTIMTQYPKAEIKKAEEILSYEAGKETKSYEVILEVEGDDDEDEMMEVKLSPEGKVLKVEEDEEGEDEGKDDDDDDDDDDGR